MRVEAWTLLVQASGIFTHTVFWKALNSSKFNTRNSGEKRKQKACMHVSPFTRKEENAAGLESLSPKPILCPRSDSYERQFVRDWREDTTHTWWGSEGVKFQLNLDPLASYPTYSICEPLSEFYPQSLPDAGQKQYLKITDKIHLWDSFFCLWSC